MIECFLLWGRLCLRFMLFFAQRFSVQLTSNAGKRTREHLIPAPPGGPSLVRAALLRRFYALAGKGMTSACFVATGAKLTRCACAMLCSRRKWP